MSHALLPPSGAPAWVHCGLWVLMNQAYPQPPDEKTMEGDAFHWLCAKTIENYPNVHIASGVRAPNAVVIDDEMQEGLEIVLASVEPEKRLVKGSGFELHIEHKMRGTWVHESLHWGTPDLVTFKNGFLDIWDWKYGHLFVDEFEAWQLICYALFWLQHLVETLKLDDSQIVVRMHVVQPRAYHSRGPHRIWTVRGSDLRAYANILHSAAEQALSEKPIATTGSHCRDCPGRHACEAYQQAAQAAIEVSKAGMPHELPPEALGAELRMLWAAKERLDGRITGLAAEADKLMRMNIKVPHTKFESTSGREAWVKPIDEVIALGEVLGKKLAKPSAVTPNQARSMGVPEEVIKEFASRPTGGLKLVLDDGTAARRAFGNP